MVRTMKDQSSTEEVSEWVYVRRRLVNLRSGRGSGELLYRGKKVRSDQANPAPFCELRNRVRVPAGYQVVGRDWFRLIPD
jgi:hypothetical protein